MHGPSFDTLPRELRYRIYLFATPARYVYLQSRDDSVEEPGMVSPPVASVPPFSRNPYRTTDRRVSFTSATQIPPLLHTSRESRQHLIRKGYELTFGTRGCNQRTWFNYKQDTLIVPCWSDAPVFILSSHSLQPPRVTEIGGLLEQLKRCQIHHLQKKYKERIRKIAKCSFNSIHRLAGLPIPRTWQVRGSWMPELDLEKPAVYQTSDLAWWGEICNSQSDSGPLLPAS